jgi:hypothetical protein
MSKIRGYEAQDKQTTTSKMKKLCTNKQTLHNLQMTGILLLLETSKPSSGDPCHNWNLSSFFLAATGDVGLRV